MTPRDSIDHEEANLRAQIAADEDATDLPRCQLVTLPPGETLRVQGHLTPEGVAALGQIVEAAREQFAGMSPNEIRAEVGRRLACRACGCTETDSCEARTGAPCGWVSGGLCTGCAQGA